MLPNCEFAILLPQISLLVEGTGFPFSPPSHPCSWYLGTLLSAWSILLWKQASKQKEESYSHKCLLNIAPELYKIIFFQISVIKKYLSRVIVISQLGCREPALPSPLQLPVTQDNIIYREVSDRLLVIISDLNCYSPFCVCLHRASQGGPGSLFTQHFFLDHLFVQVQVLGQ